MNYPKTRYKGKGPWLDRDWLYNEYITLDKSSQQIADENGCKRSTIQSWLADFKIKKEVVRRNIRHPKPYQTKDYLYQKHIVEHIPLAQIAKENNVDYDTIKYFCNKYNIKTWRSVQPSVLPQETWEEIFVLYQSGLSTAQLERLYGVSHPAIKRHLKKNNIHIRGRSDAQFAFHGIKPSELLDDKDWLEFQHFSLNQSCKDLGERLGVDPGTVRRHMKKLGIKPKNNSESKKGILAGSKHHNWKGGITPLNLLLREYFTVNLAPLAAKRDKYTCQKCGKTHTILNVHHIKKFSDIVQEILSEHKDLNPSVVSDRLELYKIITKDFRFLDLDNLITLCRDCHKLEHKK